MARVWFMEVDPKNAELKAAEPLPPPESVLEEALERSPLEQWCDTERLLRNKTLGTIVPFLPEEAAVKVQDLSDKADEALDQLATIEVDSIDDEALRSPRILIGLTFVGFGALMILFLLVYLGASHPDLNPVDRVRTYWYQYIWFVCVGIAGMFMLGREAMRPAFKAKPDDLTPPEQN